jgi:serine phosphatase RsbU (regulator of sigma subunit)
VPAEERMVGGDWYDAFMLPSGELWVVVGDVAGHGLQAAVVMGRIRSALRSYTLLDVPPEEVLRLVDRKVQVFEIETLATVVCAVTKAPFDSVTMAVAGHPPPVIATPGSRAALADIEVGPPLGLGARLQREATTHPLPPGSVVAFYTDGLIERRGESLDIGLERLCDAVTPGPPTRVAVDVMHSLIADTIPQDDVALLVMRTGADGLEA